MKIDWSSSASKTITLEEFDGRAKQLYDHERPETAWNLRGDLLALANNSQLISELMLKAVRRRVVNSQSSLEQPTYHFLHRCDKYSIRATIWLPESENHNIRNIENNLFAYDYPHNHDFDLLTVNCFGLGYSTEVFEIQENLGFRDSVGKEVDAVHRGRLRLSQGTAFFYEAGRDVHSQIPVESPSVALNFMPNSPTYEGVPQFSFDISSPQRLRINGKPVNKVARVELFGIFLKRISETDLLGDRFSGIVRDIVNSDQASATEISMLADLLRSSEHLGSAISEYDWDNSGYRVISERERNRRTLSA